MQKFKVSGQSVQKIENVQKDGQRNGLTEAIALPDSPMRSATIVFELIPVRSPIRPTRMPTCVCVLACRQRQSRCSGGTSGRTCWTHGVQLISGKWWCTALVLARPSPSTFLGFTCRKFVTVHASHDRSLTDCSAPH